MRQVDFYLISNHVAQAELKLASRLANKLMALKQRVLLVTDTEDEATDLDKMLWSFSDTSFVAHDRLPSKTPVHSTIHIAVGSDLDEALLAFDYNVLINLGSEVPDCQARFPRIAEVIAADERSKSEGRLRFKKYKAQNLEIKTHPIEI